MSLWFNSVAVLGFLFISGCGYTLNHRLIDTFQNDKGIYIPIFHNGTEEVGAEMIFTNALIRQLQSHGEKIVYSEAESGLILKGSLQSSNIKAGNFVGIGDASGLYAYNQFPDQISVPVNVNLTLLETSTKRLVWSQNYSGSRAVSGPRNRQDDKDAPSSLGLITQSLFELAYADIARDIASSAYDGMVELY